MNTFLLRGGFKRFNDLHIDMSSIAQLVSEIAHSYGQPNNHSLREKIRSVIIHTRAEIIRRSYENHNYVDKLLTQRFKVTLTSVVDGDFELPEELQDIPIDKIKINKRFQDLLDLLIIFLLTELVQQVIVPIENFLILKKLLLDFVEVFQVYVELLLMIILMNIFICFLLLTISLLV